MSDPAPDRPAPGPAARGPVQPRERSLAPDLARGAALLFIALANSPLFLWGQEIGLRGKLAGGSLADRVVNFALLTFVDGRAYPMFAFLFGYGMVQLAGRQEAAGVDRAATRRVLMRRNGWLVAFGAVHGLLLFSGDILGPYGVCGLLITAFLLFSREGSLRVVVWIWMGVLAVGSLFSLVGLAVTLALMTEPGPAGATSFVLQSVSAPDYPASVVDRLIEWPASAVGLGVFLIPAVLTGVWAARHRLLDDPAAHRRTLVLVAVVGLGAAYLGGAPLGLAAAGAFPTDEAVAGSAFGLHYLTGLAAGPGYAALFGLVALWFEGRRAGTPAGSAPPAHQGVIGALAALGRRSLSGYLVQSVVWVALFSPYTLALGAQLGNAATAALAGATWLATVAAAWLLERYGRRAPAEVLLRRLAYGRPAPRPGG
ncbi:DUF418 domain-containing protein [Allonocardiopsis opalescens]|uniref:Putative membrane protein YeiB n=1 Tax=Allonocardiopsis opalescens TaxID=1144618 RepID=A0A2T0PZL3_9ACTN|nr:DUF418 domain-containing protein [Allonocardiopsis opalescens]PRX96989.1 putative membrane protein YeiB [Allonocardiopsis opalescens]